MADLTRREFFIFVPLVLLAFCTGVYPNPIIAPFFVPVSRLLEFGELLVSFIILKLRSTFVLFLFFCSVPASLIKLFLRILKTSLFRPDF